MVTKKWKVRSNIQLQETKNLWKFFLSNLVFLHSGSQTVTDARPRAVLVSCPQQAGKTDWTKSKLFLYHKHFRKWYFNWQYRVAFLALLCAPWPVFASLLFLEWNHLSLSKEKLKTHNCQLFWTFKFKKSKAFTIKRIMEFPERYTYP